MLLDMTCSETRVEACLKIKREISWYHFTGSLQKKTQTQGQDV